MTSTYDPRGRLTQDGCSTFSYDGFDRKVQAAAASNRSSGCAVSSLSTTTYGYDGLDRQRSFNSGSGATAVHYDGLGSRVIDDTLATGTDTFYALDAQGTPLAVASGTTREWLAQDGTGSVAMTTSASDAAVCTLNYDAFGSPLSPRSAANPCNGGSTASQLFFHDGQLDPSTGQYQFGSRTYDPTKAAWLTPDHYRVSQPHQDLSIGADPLTLNRYGYVNGDPVNLRDPDGHDAWWQDAGPTNGSNGSTLTAAQINSVVNAAAPAIHHDVGNLGAGAVKRSGPSPDRHVQPAPQQQSRPQASTAHLVDVNDVRTVTLGAGTGLGTTIDTLTGRCVNCSGTREVDGRSYRFNSGMHTWVCGDRDAQGTNCGESATYRFNYRSNSAEQYDDGERTVGGWLGEHKGDIAINAAMIAVQFIPVVDVAADAIMGARAAQGAVEIATEAASGVASAPRYINSARVLIRAGEESGPYHNFPETFDDEILARGTRTVEQNCYKDGRPLVTGDSVLYQLEGSMRLPRNPVLNSPERGPGQGHPHDGAVR